MKRTILIAAIGLSLASCGKSDEQIAIEATWTPEQRTQAEVGSHTVWTDPVTGCDYIKPHPSVSYGVMPRTDRDGFHAYCAEQKERDAAEALARGCTRPRMSDGSLGAEVCINTNANEVGAE